MARRRSVDLDWADGNTLVAKWPQGLIASADAVEFMDALPPAIADILFLDPPFNLGKEYGRSSSSRDLMSSTDYSRFIKRVLSSSLRLLKNGGGLYLYHVPQWAVKCAAFLDGQLDLRHWIAVSMKNGFVRGNRLYPAHYALLYYTKGPPATFTRPRIPAQKCRHCGKYVKDYGGYAKYMRKGVNLSDVWDDLSPVRHRSTKHRRANELPLELVHRIIAISGARNGLVIDPFVGSGTTMVAAHDHQMRFIVSDRDRTTCSAAARRFRLHLANAG
jgi:site-specific DNA-methyltransferase (adenine-specific)